MIKKIGMKSVGEFIINGDAGCPTLVLAHGAGAGMESDFMSYVATELAQKGLRVIRFNFLYMQQQLLTGKRRPPDRAPKLLAHYSDVLDRLALSSPYVIGGKSMGGRMATVLATQRDVAGVVVFGYPFHALGKPEKVRVDHFPELSCPVLVCQGERDTMGNVNDVTQYRLAENMSIEWYVDGDHDLKPRKSSGLSHDQHLQAAVNRVSQFIHEITAS
jgi:predicted alpha/beta-hydrolase family hydrolase